MFELAGLEGMSFLPGGGDGEQDDADVIMRLFWTDAYDSEDIFDLAGQ